MSSGRPRLMGGLGTALVLALLLPATSTSVPRTGVYVFVAESKADWDHHVAPGLADALQGGPDDLVSGPSRPLGKGPEQERQRRGADVPKARRRVESRSRRSAPLRRATPPSRS